MGGRLMHQRAHGAMPASMKLAIGTSLKVLSAPLSISAGKKIAGAAKIGAVSAFQIAALRPTPARADDITTAISKNLAEWAWIRTAEAAAPHGIANVSSAVGPRILVPWSRQASQFSTLPANRSKNSQ